MRTPTVLAALALVIMAVFAGGPDGDGDGVPDDVDCRPADGTLWSPPGAPVTDLMLSRTGSSAALHWSTPSDTGGQSGTARYDAFGSFEPDAFGHPTGFCVELDGVDLTATAERTPAAGEVVHYLVRVENDCGTGPVDTDPAPVVPRSLNFLIADNTNASGSGSLTEAIGLAVDGDAICVATSGTITIPNNPLINKNIAIVGPGADLLTIDGGFTLAKSEHLSGMTLVGIGVGIGVYGTATLDSMEIKNTNAGVWVANPIGHAKIVNSKISGAFYGVKTSGQGCCDYATITTSTISGNTIGVAISDYGGATIDSSTISGNGVGVDADNYGNVVISTSTISGNGTGVHFAGFEMYATATITSSAIAGNSIGIHGEDADFGSLQNTVLSNGTNCTGNDLPSGGHNLSSDTSCPNLTATGDQVAIDPLLGPLGDNGGPTATRAPLPGSPIVDAGFCPGQTRDQRGMPRPVDDPGVPNVSDACDIGPVEKQ